MSGRLGAILLLILCAVIIGGCGTPDTPTLLLAVDVSADSTGTFGAYGFLTDAKIILTDAVITVNGTTINNDGKTRGLSTFPGLNPGSTVTITAHHQRIGTVTQSGTVPTTVTGCYL